MSNQIVNISYLKTFVSGVLTVNQGSYADSYCPTYEQLTDGTFVVNYVANNNPTLTTNGIKVNGTYANNQLVKREDLTMLYQILQSVNVTAHATTISCCGGSTTLSTTAYFKLRTVKENETTDASTNTSANVTSKSTYSDSKSYTSISGSKITFTKNSINYPTNTSAAARTTTVTGKYNYSSTTKEDTVNIRQNANSVDSSWTNTTQTTTSIGVTDSLSFGAAGGTKNYTVTRYYTQYQEKYDSCDALMDSNSYNTSTTVTPTSYTTNNSAFTCTSNNVTVGAQESGAEERNGILTVRWGDFQDTCSLSQSPNAIDDSWTATGDPYSYSYSVSVNPWNDLNCSGGTTYATATLSWKQDYVKYDSLGAIVSSKTENESSDVTNSTTWSTTRGSISSNGVLTYPASTSTGEIRTTVTGKYGTYQDTDYMTQIACGATGYTYQILSITFASSSIGKCDTTAPAVTVNARSGKTNSDGSTTWYSAKDLSTSEYTISYNPALSQNTSNSERIITATVKYKTVQKTATITQDAGPCDTATTRTEYEIQVLDASMGKCETTVSPIVQGRSRTVTSHTDGSADEYGNWSDWSDLSSSDYSLSFNPSLGANQTSSQKTYTATATGKGNYVGKSDTATITQAAGPCDTATTRTEYEIQVLDTSMGKCETTVSPIVQGRSRTVTSHTDGSADEYGNWSTWSDLTSSNYSLSFSPSLGANQTSSQKTYTVTASGKGNYVGKIDTATITQDAGPCDTATTRTEYEIQVLDLSMGKCETTVSPIVQGRSRIVTSHTDGSVDEYGNWSDWGDLSSSNYSLSFSPSLGVNTTSSEKTYTVTATGNGNYVGKSDTATITQAAGPCDTETTRTEYEIQVLDTSMGKCETTVIPIVQGRSRTVTSHTDGSSDEYGNWSDWSDLTSSNYSLSFNPSLGVNTTSSQKTYTVTVTGSGNYVGKTDTATITQAAGPCDTATTRTEYEIQVLDASMGKCETTVIPIVQGRSRTVTSHTDGSSDEYSNWSDWSNLSSSNYNLSYSPSLGVNTTSSQKTYTATATGKGNYVGKSDTATITQAAGPCDTATTRTEYNLRVLNLSIEKCATTASPTVQGCSRTVTSHTDGSADEYGNWSDWSNLTSSNYSLSFNPSIETNETTSTKTYTVTATGKGNYYGITSSATITQAAGPCKEYYLSFDDESILSTTMIELGESDTEFEVTVWSCYGTGVNDGTSIGYTYTTDGCTWVSSLQTNDCEQGEKFSVNAGVESGSITFTQNSSGKQIIATFTKDCSCNVNSISVNPSTYTFTSNTDEQIFTVTISNNGCSKCKGGFKVYNSSGAYVTSGQSSFSLTNTSGTYTIRAVDNTAKTDTLIVSKYVPTCNVSYDYSNATFSFEASDMGKCDTTSVISNAKITNVKRTNSDCSVSTIDETPQYTVSYSPNGANETNTSRTVYVTLTTTSAYGSMSKTVQVTQAAGPCTVQTGITTDYRIQVLDTSIEACDTSATPTVQGSSRTGTTYSDGTPTSWGTWSSWSNLSSSNYSISFNPTIDANQTSSEKTYTVTATGSGNYVGKTDTAIITQDAGPCDTTSITTEYQIQVIDTSMGKCETTVSPTVQGRSRNNTAHTSSSTVDEGTWSSWSNLSSSNYSLSYSPSISINQTPTAKTYTVTATGKGNYVGKSDTATITQAAGPCCTVGSSWSSLSVTASTVAKCDTSASFTVKANGTYTNSSCSTTSTSVTLSSSDYTVKYGTSSGSYTLDSITENNTSSSKTWYYKITASSTYGNLTYTGSFTQAPGPCKDVYVFETVFNPLDGVIIASSGVTNIQQGFLSTKNGEYCPITATPTCDWIIINNISSGTVGDNGNVVVNISFAANETTESRTCSVKFLQDGSNKEIIHSFTQEGKAACTASTVYSSLTPSLSKTVAKCDTSASFRVIANGTYTDESCTTSSTSVTISSIDYTIKYGTSSGNYTLDSITKNETTSPKTWYYKITASSTYGNLTYTGSFTQAAGPCTSKAYVGGIKIQSNAVGSISYSGFGKSGSIYAGNSFEFTNKEWYSSSSNLTVTVPVSSISNGNYLSTSAAIQIIVTGTNLSFISTNVPDGIRNTGSDVGTSGGYIAFVVVPESSSISSSSLVGKTATCVFQDFNNTTTPVTIVATIKFT